MEPSGKMAALTLVAKHHPVVANYSYLRHDASAPASAMSSSAGWYSDRSSLGSQVSSAPGLIDDRTDSELSVDDYQYHAHTTELWDSFWQPTSLPDDEPAMHPKKQYPALIPSPRSGRRRRRPASPAASAPWPLPDGSPRDRSRKPAATYTLCPPAKSSPTYSAFPKPLPPPKESPPPLPRGRGSSPKPSRPRPPGEVVIPCIRLVHPCTSQPAAKSPTATHMMDYRFPAPSPAMHLPPPSPASNWCPPSPVAQRRSRCPDEPFIRPRTAGGHAHSSSASSASASIALEQVQPRVMPSRAPRHCKSMAHLARPVPEPEPQSVFEYDSDSDSDHGRSFFRFHRRNESDGRRSTKAIPSEAAPAPQVSRRPRRQTAPSVSEPPLLPPHPPNRLSKQEPPPRRKRQGHDVFGRMLGRRSR